MYEIRDILRVASQARQEQLSPADYKRAVATLNWQRDTFLIAVKAKLPIAAPMQSMIAFFSGADGDSIGRTEGNQMLVQFAELAKTLDLEPAFKSIDEWLLTMNYVIQTAPTYNPDKAKQFFFPMSSMFVFYMFTNAGAALFRDKIFNDLLTSVLESWCTFLDSSITQKVLNPNQTTPADQGWLSAPAQLQFCLEQCANYQYVNDPNEPYWTFSSFNDFFHREWNLEEYRPLAGAGDNQVIVAANDGTVYRIAKSVDEYASFWTKGQNYSLAEMLDGSPSTQSFVGGDVLQSFLDGSDYHRWHAPISGTVIEARVIQGLTFSELLSEGLDISAGTDSQGYQTMVNTRGLVIIDNPELGKVAVLPTGITEISSIKLNVTVGQTVNKGDELGYFSYGGSTLVLAFEQGMISEFVAQEPPSKSPAKPSSNDKANCKTQGECSAEQGCLMVRSQIAVANSR